MSGFSDPNVVNQDMIALRSYISAGGEAAKYASLAAGTVMIDVTHSNLVQRHIELRFDKHETVEALKHRIHRQTGTPPDFQRLVIRQGGMDIGVIGPDDSKMIGFYSIENGMEIHCIDLNPHSASAHGGYEDVSKVQKYKMSDEEYEKRKGTLRDWAKQQKAANPSFTLEKHAKEHKMIVDANKHYKMYGELPEGFSFVNGKCTIDKKEGDDENQAPPDETTVVHATIGERCEVQPGSRRGTVMFKGEVDIGDGGFWVGVKFDEPVGKTNGTVKGKFLFDAGGLNMGGFVRGDKVVCGDFPEKDLLDSDDDDDEDEL
jgi:tubulin-folding cofactor B